MLDERDKYIHSLSLITDYTNELAEYRAKYDKIEAIKYYSSPNSGIQLIFLNLYMNKILSIANDLLGLMFGGEIEILPFVINEKEFKIPCSVAGLKTDDITSMSNSQICMVSTVIQFSLLYQSSTKLNIPRLDEIDAGLDNFNRTMFVNFLHELLTKLSINQAIIISHNNEIMNSDVDVIVLRNNGKKEINGNVIYHY
jgi:DNA repair exonuclease SbcCD ATPase subunit